MNSTLEHTDYTNYSFEDFLQDSYFVESMKKPSKESVAFWRSAVNTLKNYDDFVAAQNFLKSLGNEAKKESLSEDEVSALWSRIDHDTIERSINKSHLKIYWRYISVAASVLILLSVGYLSYYYVGNQQDNILSFALQEIEGQLPSDGEAILILSDKKQIGLKEDEATVSYSDSSQVITVKAKSLEEAIDKDDASAFNQLVTPKGKRSTLILADGSKVWLNAGTRVIYPKEFEADKREIFVDGEIYIEVTPDKEKPFYVKTKNLDVRVLGTKFDVKSYPGEGSEKVILVSGAVAVDNRDYKNNAAQLIPNQMYESKGTSMQVRKVDAERYISWTRGLYTYEDESMDEILQGLCRYYGVQIEFINKENNLKYSGKLDLKQSFDELLEGLKNITSIEFSKEESGKYMINFKQ